MTLKEMMEKRQRLVAQAREALNEINANTDDARVAELEARHDTIMSELDALDAKIAREERVAAAERSLEQRAARQRPTGQDIEVPGEDPGDEPVSYRQAFAEMLRAGGMPSEMRAEARAALLAGVVRDAEFRAQTAGTTTAGGYTVPTELAAEIIRSMAMWGPMYDEAICTVLNTTSGNPIDLPTVNDTAVTAGAHTEGAALTDDGGKDVTFGKKTLNAYVYDTEFVRFSMELAQDSVVNMEAFLASILGERLARIANLQLTTGDGTGDPNGIVTASTLGKTAAAAAALASDEIIDLLHSVDPAYRMSPKARFMFNDATLAAVRKLKDGDGNYLWQLGDVQKGVPGTLLGYQYSVNQAMDALAASKKVMLFGDFGKYIVRKVGAPTIGVLRERFWPDLGIAGLIRFDGELGDTAAVKHLITAAS